MPDGNEWFKEYIQEAVIGRLDETNKRLEDMDSKREQARVEAADRFAKLEANVDHLKGTAQKWGGGIGAAASVVINAVVMAGERLLKGGSNA